MISVLENEYDGSGSSNTLTNDRFNPFLWSLKMKINILINLLYKMYIKQKARIKHTHTVLRIFVNIPLQKTYTLCVYLIYHTNTPIFSFNTTVSSCIHAFFLFLYFYILNTSIFSSLWSPILSRRYFISRKKTSFFCLKANTIS